MTDSFRVCRRVEWRDTDAAGIAHFTALLQMMEEAEHELLRHLGLSVHIMEDDGPLSWPRVSVKADFQSPVKFDDVVDIDVCVTRLGEKSVTYGFSMSCAGRSVAEGEIVAVCCRVSPGEKPTAVPIPASIAQRLGGSNDD